MSYSRLLLSLSSLLLFSACSQQEPVSDAPVVAPRAVTTAGMVEGMNESGISVYKGIPYARPPVGELRWRSPQTVDNWEGVKAATRFGNDCMQKPFAGDAAPLGEEPAEDCLYMNVWTPEHTEDTQDKRPVVVWIHGGGFVNGGASPATYSGESFARSGVVFASFNYRLGRFGFFAHPALTEASDGPIGNYGFEDQIAAMQWVQNNIAAFGGDPQNVTVIGESAGGASVFNLLTTPTASGLFQRAVVMSGGGRGLMRARAIFDTENGEPSAEQIGVNFAQKYGIKGTGPEALAKLRELPAEAVVDGFNLSSLFQPPQDPPTYPGAPLLDGEIVRGHTEALLKAGKVAKVTLMIGTTSQDLGYAPFQNKDALFASFGEYAMDAQNAYDPGGDTPLNELAVAVGQDRAMQEPARFVAQQLTAQGLDVYLYRYGYVAESVRNGQGTPHAAEIPFFFNTADIKYPDASEQDLAAAERVFSYVVSFAKDGDPNLPRYPQWQPYDNEKQNIMIFNMDATAEEVSDPWAERLDAVQGAEEAVPMPELR
ncbi:carboxylesterase/lipase family protein [Alteromonas sp. H39]|uniref:carboxylesterase/lipase family protein n=1 Tax=Alteromonas sp. H39 TaxID=3389876 RepID=UPI0039E0F148